MRERDLKFDCPKALNKCFRQQNAPLEWSPSPNFFIEISLEGLEMPSNGKVSRQGVSQQASLSN